MSLFIEKTIGGALIVFGALSLVASAGVPAASPQPPVKKNGVSEERWLKGIFRVNTEVSAGCESLDEVCSKAEAADLDFIVVSDQFLVKAEYGVLPFRNAFSYSMERRSVRTFGVDRYLTLVDSVGAARPGIVLIPGVDVAPHYYWSGTPFTKNFSTNRFSEQLTVFGPDDPEFYTGLPVVHNTARESLRGSILKLLPLLMAVWGIALCFKLRTGEYRDAAGRLLNSRFSRGRLSVALLLVVAGVLWTLDNRPFTRDLGFSQYADAGVAPFQKLIDYVGERGGESAAVVWSAPEAEMNDILHGVHLRTDPYLSDVAQTRGHNGMAGLYGDAVTALRPGGEWDAMLSEYCSGKRRLRPIIVGELDYHGRKRRIDMYQTVVLDSGKNRKAIFDAIVAGRSYAYAKPAGYDLELLNVGLESGEGSASLGGALNLPRGAARIAAVLFLGVSGDVPKGATGLVNIVANGKLVSRKAFPAEGVSRLKVVLDDVVESLADKDLGYVRFDISFGSARIATNPVFYRHRIFTRSAQGGSL